MFDNYVDFRISVYIYKTMEHLFFSLLILCRPLRDEEKLPVLTHRTVESPPVPLEQPAEKVKKHHRHKDKSRSKDMERKLKSKSKDYQSSKNSKKVSTMKCDIMAFLSGVYVVSCAL